MKGIEIKYPLLGDNKLVLKLSGVFGSPKLFLNDRKIEKFNKKYSMTEKIGKPFEVQLKSNGFDPVPKVIINNDEFEIVTPFKWYEYLVMGLPILLALQGGALGALFGFAALKANSTIFRSDRKILEKYLLIIGLNIVVVLLFLGLAMLIGDLLGRS